MIKWIKRCIRFFTKEKNMKATDFANYILYLYSDIVSDISNMKLNKLLYFIYGYYYKETGELLFDETFEAWEHGPIVPSVYNKYKSYENKPIKDYDSISNIKVFKKYNHVISDVMREFGNMTPSQLRNKTHLGIRYTIRICRIF